MTPPQSTQILLVARRDPQDPIGRILRGAGYAVVSVDSAPAARRSAERSRPALIVLDSRALTPASRDELATYSDEHDIPLLKDWSDPQALLTDIERLLGARDSARTDASQLTIGPLEIDFSAHLARVEGSLLDLTVREFDLLAHFARHPGWVSSCQELLEQVWGYEYGDTKVVTVHIANLRKKLQAAAPGLEFIETVRGVGYRLVVPDTEDARVPASAGVSEAPEPPTPAENPLYRRVFVGREQQLDQLKATFQRSASGQGSLVMVTGEPGIGKTALCEQLSAYVTDRGGRTLYGHCYEEGSLSLPYLAFVEALGSYVVTRPEEDLREELGGAAADVAKIVPEIKEKLTIQPRPQGDPEEERYRLLQGVTDFLASAATAQPLLLVLEDLHDADKGTLDMLLHVARHLSGTYILIVGTYRDVEVGRAHPLSGALAELRRLASYDRVLLRGLDLDEVQRLLETSMQRSLSRHLAEVVHRQTEGNPLFVQEVVRYLAEEGLLKPECEGWTAPADTLLETSIPEGLRDVIGKRLSLLSKECNRLLSVAAVIGREFSVDTLQAIVGLEEAAFLDGLEEAVQFSVLEDRSRVGRVRYRFTHAFFRQTLYEELISPRRLMLHRQIAHTLESQYAGHLQEHASELAEHFSHSTDPEDLGKAVEYGELAAKSAIDVFAYGEAVRLLDRTIEVQQVLDPEDEEKLCDLKLDLCDVLFLIADIKRIIAAEAPAAFTLAESLGDSSRAARACVPAMFSVWLGRGNVDNPVAAEWIERVDRHASPDTVERAYADAFIGLREYHAGVFGVREYRGCDRTVGLSRLDQAVALARRLGDEEALWHVASLLLTCMGAPQYVEQRMRLCEELWAGSRRGLNANSAWVLYWTIEASLARGHRQLAEEVSDEVRALVERTGNIKLQLMSASVAAGWAVVDGQLEDAMALADSVRAGGEEAGVPEAGSTLALPAIRAQMYLGASPEDLGRWMPPERLDVTPPLSCLIQAYAAQKDDASELLESHVVRRPCVDTKEDETFAFTDSVYLEAAVLVGHLKTAQLLLSRLTSPTVVTPSILLPTCVLRLLGGAAALLGRYDEAREHYRRAIEICTKMPFRPELALSRLELAELLLDHYPSEKKEAEEHLDFAIGEFREMKMQPFLERALRHKEILKA